MKPLKTMSGWSLASLKGTEDHKHFESANEVIGVSVNLQKIGYLTVSP